MINISRLAVQYGAVTALHNIDLQVATGEFVTLLGPSGCGKSTLLRAVGGFVATSSGSVTIDGRDVTSVDPENRDVGFVFQSYALFPNMTVAQNLAFGLNVRRVARAERDRRVERTLELTGLTKFVDSMPANLSGGQQQRVAIARVLVTEPSVILMDEPLSNLDAHLRVRLRAEIKRLHLDTGMTILYVTHDQEEALALSDRVAVINDGRIQQIASPQQLYHRPNSSNVCTFVGSATILGDAATAAFGVPPGKPGQRLHIRPERLRLGRTTIDSGECAPTYRAMAVIKAITFTGVTTLLQLEVAGELLAVVVTSDPNRTWNIGDSVECTFGSEDALWLS